MYEQEFGKDELDGAIQAGVGAVLAATGAAILGTILSLNFDGEADTFARGAWVVWAGVVAGWVALVLFDYWMPEKVEPAVLEPLVKGPDPELERLLAEEAEIEHRYGA
jgi:hypothetical protein